MPLIYSFFLYVSTDCAKYGCTCTRVASLVQIRRLLASDRPQGPMEFILVFNPDNEGQEHDPCRMVS